MEGPWRSKARGLRGLGVLRGEGIGFGAELRIWGLGFTGILLRNLDCVSIVKIFSR